MKIKKAMNTKKKQSIEGFAGKNGDRRQIRKATLITASVVTLSVVALVAIASAEPAGLLYRSPEHFSEQRERIRVEKAAAHYNRSRALLISALDEFDKGRQLADPSLLINSDIWRKAIILKIKTLERVLAPQPRRAKAGVHLEADSRLLGN